MYPRGASVLPGFPMAFDSGLLKGEAVAVVAKDIRRVSDMIGWARAQGSDVIVLELDQLRYLLKFRKNLSMVVVDLDVGELDEVIEEISQIRELHPAVPLVLASRFFSRDDFSLSRLTVADVSLRMPLRMSALDLAVVIAIENNERWVDRCERSGDAQQCGGK